jgi:hypothetical protein
MIYKSHVYAKDDFVGGSRKLYFTKYVFCEVRAEKEGEVKH